MNIFKYFVNTDKKEALDKNTFLNKITGQTETIVYGVLASLAGLVLIAILVIAIYYAVRVGTTSDPVVKKKWLSSIKWLGLSLVLLVLMIIIFASVKTIITKFLNQEIINPESKTKLFNITSLNNIKLLPAAKAW